MAYIDFLRRNVRPLAFGFTHVFYSAPGQTYVIGVFAPEIARSLGVGGTTVSAFYLAATLASAATLVFVGYWIDHIRLVHFSGAVVLGLGIACLVTANVNGLLMLLIAFYLLRLTGQGLMTHVDGTATARTFDRERGRALSITALGAPVSEMVFPPLAILGIATIGWQASYLVMAAVALLVILPFTQWLLRTFKRAPPGMTKPEGQGRKLWSGLSRLIRSRRMLLMLPSLSIFPFCMTAVMFHIKTIATEQTWSLAALASSYPVFAIVAMLALIASGFVIDRVSALRFYPMSFLPMIAGFTVIATFPASWAAPVAFGLMGLGAGMARPTMSAIWPEMFGTDSLGAIRSAVSMFMVFASGLSPFVFSLMLDFGLTVSGAMWVLVGYSVVSLVVTFLPARREPAEPETW